MNKAQSNAIRTGLGLIGLGILLVLANWVGWDRVWPLFPVLGGLGAWLGYFLGGARDGGLAFLGTGSVLVGVFFLGFTFNIWEWGEMSRLWPVFPLIGGISFLVLFFADRQARRDLGLLGVALAAIVVGVIAFLYTTDRISGDIWRFWPVLLVLVGVLSLFTAFFQRSRRV